jgi:hypothetical protein
MGQNDSESVRAELAQRIMTIGMAASRASASDLARDLDALRSLAQRNGFHPAATVAHALETALARGERGPLIQSWLGVLQDAVGCGRNDAHACEAYAAACSVRYQ